MLTQKVSVDVWAMVKTMFGYFFLAIVGGIFLRLVMTVVTLPARLSAQKQTIQTAMDDLKRRFPEEFKEVTDELEEKERKKRENPETEENDDECAEEEMSIEKKKIN